MSTVLVPGPLRGLTGGQATVAVTAATVRDALAELDRRHPGLAARVLDDRGALRPFVRIFVGPDDIGDLGGLATPIAAGDEIAIVPAIAGGSGAGGPALSDDQLRRYARHIAVPDIGRAGQAAWLAGAARLPASAWTDGDAASALVAATYLAAAGVGVVVVPDAAAAPHVAARGPDTRVVAESIADAPATEVALPARPAWWPGAAGDDAALALWRGSAAATAWLRGGRRA